MSPLPNMTRPLIFLSNIDNHIQMMVESYGLSWLSHHITPPNSNSIQKRLKENVFLTQPVTLFWGGWDPSGKENPVNPKNTSQAPEWVLRGIPWLPWSVGSACLDVGVSFWNPPNGGFLLVPFQKPTKRGTLKTSSIRVWI